MGPHPLFINQDANPSKGSGDNAPANLLLPNDHQPKSTLTMLSTTSTSSSSADSGCHPSGTFDEVGVGPKTVVNPPFFRDSSGRNITKYLVLLQDCLAIKFVSVGSGAQTGRRFRGSRSVHQLSSLRRSWVFDGDLFSDEDASDVPLSLESGGVGLGVDPKSQIQGLQLYKSFLEANLKCYWNATLCEAIRSLEYKGWLLPSTILVGGGSDGSGSSSSSCRLSLIRTAWARKMLRHPPGFRIEFVGEIEEIIAEPTSQGQFAPLSDSLCWAILELTSSGQEAFVDSILTALSVAFPLMSLPPRELVYTTLERLIRDRKIYQTSQGYFIVSPDTFRYMNAGGEGSGQTQGQGQTGNYPTDPRIRPLDALTASYYDADGDPDKLSQHSFSSGGDSRDDLLSPRCRQDREILSAPPLKRHNSLRVIRQRDLDVLTPTMGARSLSFRLSKTRSLLAPDQYDNHMQGATHPCRNVGEQLGPRPVMSSAAVPLSHQKDKKLKKPSFFRRFFSFRRSSSKPNVSSASIAKGQKPAPNPRTSPPAQSNPKLGPNHKQMSLEHLQRSPKIYAQLPPRKTSPPTPSKEYRAPNPTRNRSYEDILEDEIILLSSRGGQNQAQSRAKGQPISKWNSLPSSSSGRRSRRSILNESPFYDVLHFNLGPYPNNARDPGSSQPQPQFLRHPGSRASSTSGHVPTNTRPQRPLSMGGYSGGYSKTSGKSFETLQNSESVSLSKKLSAPSDPRRRSLPRIDSPSPSVSAIYASISGGVPVNGGAIETPRNKADSLPPPGPVPTPTQVHLRGRSSRYPPWRPRSAYELLAYQNLQSCKKQEPKIQEIVQNTAVSSHYHVFKPYKANTNRSTIKSRTELQLQIPAGRPPSSNIKITPVKNISGQNQDVGQKIRVNVCNSSAIITSESPSHNDKALSNSSTSTE